MAKKEKKKIADFQQALQQNIREAVGEDSSSADSFADIKINQRTWKQFANLAQKEGVSPEKLAEIALEHFVRTKEVWFSKE